MIKRIRQKMVVFDLDGTLIDTAPDLFYSANEVIKDIIKVDIDYEVSKKFIGWGGEYFIKRNLKQNNINLSQEKIDNLIKKFLVIYEDNISKSTNIIYQELNILRDQAIIDQINDFMCKLFPEKELLEYMWDHLASCLIGMNQNQTFNIYTGSGRN